MMRSLTFGEVLDAADHLATDEQEALVEILRRRISEQRRRRLVEDVREARREHGEGRTKAVSIDDLLGEILS